MRLMGPMAVELGARLLVCKSPSGAAGNHQDNILTRYRNRDSRSHEVQLNRTNLSRVLFARESE